MKATLDDIDVAFEGIVADVIFEGERLLYEITVPALSKKSIRIFHHDQNDFATHELGQDVFVGWKSRDFHIFVAGKEGSE